MRKFSTESTSRESRPRNSPTHADKLGQFLLELFQPRFLDLVLLDEFRLDRAELFAFFLKAALTEGTAVSAATLASERMQDREAAEPISLLGESSPRGVRINSPFPLCELERQPCEHELVRRLVRVACWQRHLQAYRRLLVRRELPQLVEVVQRQVLVLGAAESVLKSATDARMDTKSIELAARVLFGCSDFALDVIPLEEEVLRTSARARVWRASAHMYWSSSLVRTMD